MSPIEVPYKRVDSLLLVSTEALPTSPDGLTCWPALVHLLPGYAGIVKAAHCGRDFSWPQLYAFQLVH